MRAGVHSPGSGDRDAGRAEPSEQFPDAPADVAEPHEADAGLADRRQLRQVGVVHTRWPTSRGAMRGPAPGSRDATTPRRRAHTQRSTARDGRCWPPTPPAAAMRSAILSVPAPATCTKAQLLGGGRHLGGEAAADEHVGVAQSLDVFVPHHLGAGR